MSCSLTAGHSLDCKDTIGGIHEVFFVAFDTLENGITVTSNEVSDLPDMTLYRYELPKNTGSFTENITSSVENGTVYWEQVLEFTVFELTTAMRVELESLARGRWMVFVRDRNDNMWLMGRYCSAEVTGGSQATGTAKGDLNGYTVTMTAEEKEPAIKVASGLKTTYWFDTVPTGTVTVDPSYT